MNSTERTPVVQRRPPLTVSRRIPPGGRGNWPDPDQRRQGHHLPPPFSPGTFPVMALALMLTGGAVFLPAIPLWCAGLPLLMAIMAQGFTTRFGLALAFVFWPGLITTLGLSALGYPTLPVSLGAALAVLILPFAMAWLGIVPVSLALLLIPVFPATPLPALVDALPGPVPLTGLGLLLFALLIVEGVRIYLLRLFLLLLFCAVLGTSHLFAALFADQTETRLMPPDWVEHPVPAAITERGGWVRLRDSLPPGAQAILGENLFTEGDVDALAFWRQAARDRDLTLWIGVEARDGRGTLLRLAPQDTAIDPAPVAAARYGIPGITGTWAEMPPLSGGDGRGSETGIDWLFCYEALLPQAWMPLLGAPRAPDTGGTRPIVILANDRWLGPLPFHVTRRKIARAMGRMARRQVYVAETGRTILLRNTEGNDHDLD